MNTSRGELIERALIVASRVAHEGGVGSVELPDPQTGQLTTLEIDQTRAEALVAWCNDSIAITVWEKIRDGEPLAQTDRDFLRQWTDATLADEATTERERQIASAIRRSKFRLVDGDQT